jgi:hypothetical protein
MKKFVAFILLVVFTITGCTIQPPSSSNSEIKEDIKLKILAPTGAPSLAFYEQLASEEFETNTVPTNIVGSMAKQDYDFIVIDLVSGLNMIKNGAEYKLSAVLTFGNYYILSLGNDEDKVLDQDDVLVSFGKDLTPDLIFKDLYPNITPKYFVNGVSEVAPVAISGMFNQEVVDYVFIAQPLMQNVLAKNNKAEQYADIQKSFSTKYNIQGIPQAGLFVSNTALTTKATAVNEFSNKLKSNIEVLLANPSILDNYKSETNETKLGINIEMAKTVLANNNGVNLGYKKAREYYANLEAYYEVLNLSGLSLDYMQ